MKKVLLRYFSDNNLGHDLFVLVLTRRYIDHFTCFSNANNKSLNEIKNLHIIRKSAAYYLISKTLARLSYSRNMWLLKALEVNDLFIYVGGSIFQETGKINPWHREALFYKQCRRPYYILGSNIGPYTAKNQKEFLQTLETIFQPAADICFREYVSYDHFNHLPNVRIASDIVFSMPTSKLKIIDGNLVVFSIIDCYKRFDTNIALRYEKLLIALTEKFIGMGYQICYLPFWRGDGDLKATKRIYGQLTAQAMQNVRVLPYEGNIDEVLGVISGCSIVVATRFHATILGLLFGKKVLPLAYSTKITNVLQDIDFKGPIIDIQNIQSFDIDSFSPDSLLFNNVDKQRKLAETQFQELDKVLTRRMPGV